MEIVGIILLIAVAAASGFLVSVMANLNYIPGEYLKPIYAIIVVLTGYAWVLIVTAVIEKVVEPTIGVTKAHGLKNVFYILAAIIVIVVVSTVFNFNLTGVLIGAGFAGIVLGLAAQQVLGNIFAGLSLLASRPFEIGDRITLVTASYTLMGETYAHEAMLNGFTGVVTDITIFFTKMDLDNGTPAVFPNSVIVGSMAVNHSKVTSRTVRVRLDLDKRVDFESFSKRFLESLREAKDIDAAKSQVELSDIGSTTYQVLLVVWTSNNFEQPVKTLMIRNALKIQADLNSQLKQ
jgi:small conductance mechanosensitive channel